MIIWIFIISVAMKCCRLLKSSLKKCENLIFCMVNNTHDMAMVFTKFAENNILCSRQYKCYWNSSCLSLILLTIQKLIAPQRSVIHDLVIIAQSFASNFGKSWKYFPVTALDNWIVFPVLNRGYPRYFPNFSEIYHKKMFACYQVALGRSGSGNVGALCLG